MRLLQTLFPSSPSEWILGGPPGAPGRFPGGLLWPEAARAQPLSSCTAGGQGSAPEPFHFRGCPHRSSRKALLPRERGRGGVGLGWFLPSSILAQWGAAKGCVWGRPAGRPLLPSKVPVLGLSPSPEGLQRGAPRAGLEQGGRAGADPAHALPCSGMSSPPQGSSCGGRLAQLFIPQCEPGTEAGTVAARPGPASTTEGRGREALLCLG